MGSDAVGQGRVDRRALLAGMLGLAGSSLTARSALASSFQAVPTPSSSGDCSIEPGVQLYIDWRSGLPVIPLGELLPPIDWKVASHASLPLSMLIPPDWELQSGWADTYSREGMPLWQPEPMQVPQLTLARIISPDSTAAMEYVVGNIQGDPLSTQQVAVIAKLGILGEGQQLRSVCAYDDQNPLAPTWFDADRVNRSVLVSTGTALGLPDFYLPATTVTYNNLYGPRTSFESLMRTVFIRIFFQFLGGGDVPTLTPTPDF